MRVDGKAVILPKIGRVAMVEELRFRGSIREVTINRIRLGPGSPASALKTVRRRHR